MPELNKANRQVCDVEIRNAKTMLPFLNFDTANATTAGLTSDSVYAMAKGARRIAFQNPLEGTMTIEAQVYPFKFFALLTDGTIESSAEYAEHVTIKATEAGKLPLKVTGGTVKAGFVFVFPKGEYGNEAKQIVGTFATDAFTATTSSEIAVDGEYEVGFIVTRTSGVNKIAFNNKKIPADYYITMKTLDKDEDGTLTPFLIIAYHATAQRSFELSFSSEGDPASVTMTFDLLENKNGDILDMVEINESLVINPADGT